MKYYLLCGRTGVGKSSFVNATFGVQLAKHDRYRPCTKVIEYFTHDEANNQICLIDTPGLAEGDDQLDLTYLGMIKQRIEEIHLEAMIYITPLKDTHFRPEEQHVLKQITERLDPRVWISSWLVLTFAASIPSEERDEVAHEWIGSIERFLRDLTSKMGRGRSFSGFRQHLLVDNVVPNWTTKGQPLLNFFR